MQLFVAHLAVELSELSPFFYWVCLHGTEYSSFPLSGTHDQTHKAKGYSELGWKSAPTATAIGMAAAHTIAILNAS